LYLSLHFIFQTVR